MRHGTSTLKALGEFGIIDRIRRQVHQNRSVLVGIGDDTAVLRQSRRMAGRHLLFTTDMLIEDRHFRFREASAFGIGWKAMAVNLSDIAAMGGKPLQAVVSVGLPADLKPSFIKALLRGLESAATRFGSVIVGGDTNRSDKLVINVALLGQAPKGGAILRSGARVGDVIFVTGRLGGSYASGKHLNFTPRLKESGYLASGFKIHAMIDLSDGLASDIHRITEASGVGAILFEERIPVALSAKGLKAALTDGEDFELLFTLPPKEAARLAGAIRGRAMASMTPIGVITKRGSGVRLLGRDGKLKALHAKGFDHFK